MARSRTRLRRVLLAVVLGACTPQSADRPADGGLRGGAEVVDDAGVGHAVLPQRQRIVSTIPGITDLFIELGEVDRLVARTRYDTRPEVAHLPSVGGGLDPDLETLTVLEPDLVVMWTDTDARSMTQRIAGLGIDAYAARVDGFGEFRKNAAKLGQLTGLESEVGQMLEKIDAAFNEIDEALGTAERPSVLYVIGLDPPMIAGPGTFLDSLVTVGGGNNVFADLEVAWPQVSLESIVQRNPDWVVISAQEGSYAPLAERRDGWAQVEAIQMGRVIEVDPDVFNRPGPNIERAARTLARALHPTRFDSIGDPQR